MESSKELQKKVARKNGSFPNWSEEKTFIVCFCESLTSLESLKYKKKLYCYKD